MARKPGIRYWASRGSWVDELGQFRRGGYWTTIRGKQCLLQAGPDDEPDGPAYLAALQAFADLMSLDNADRAGDANTCRIVLECYLRDAVTRVQPEVFQRKWKILKLFCETHLAEVPVGKLTPFAVNAWLSEMRRPRQVKQRHPHKKTLTQTVAWGDGTCAIAVKVLHAAFNWAARQGVITANPVRGLERISERSRSRDCLVSPEDHQRILGHTRGEFRDFVVCLENTGCRPGELLKATARDWNEELGALVFYGDRRRQPGEATHKTAKKDKDRRIFFRGDALRIMRERVRRYREGHLWHVMGKPRRALTGHHIRTAFEQLRKRIGMPKLTAYSYRHTFATRWLEAGRSIDDLAALMGNTAAVIRRNYAHLADNLDRMGDLADSFTSARAESPPRVLPFGKVAE